MPLEILTGPDVPALLARAQQKIGADAVVVSVRRLREGGRNVFEMVAADAATAERQHRLERRGRSAEALLASERPAAVPAARPAAPAGRPAPVARRASEAPEDVAGFWNLERTPAPAPVRAPVPARPAASARSTPRRFAWPFAPAARGGSRPQVIALVGPTGAGKTTTIAKLANHPQAFAERRVGLLCLDTYRVGGVEQARQYAELSKLPFEVLWDAQDLPRIMRRLQDCQVVLVDTPGRGPRAAADLRETHARLLELAPDEVHLVLPAGLQASLARRVLTAHLPLGVTHLLPTKLDEYPDERGLFELARQFALPMRWLADGQEVPHDLQLAPETAGSAAFAALVGEGV